MSVSVYEYIPQENIKKRRKSRAANKNQSLTQDDILILATLEKIQNDLENARRSLDEVTDPDLIDSFVYEINALNMRHKVYLQICKDRGLVSAMFR